MQLHGICNHASAGIKSCAVCYVVVVEMCRAVSGGAAADCCCTATRRIKVLNKEMLKTMNSSLRLSWFCYTSLL